MAGDQCAGLVHADPMHESKRLAKVYPVQVRLDQYERERLEARREKLGRRSFCGTLRVAGARSLARASCRRQRRTARQMHTKGPGPHLPCMTG